MDTSLHCVPLSMTRWDKDSHRKILRKAQNLAKTGKRWFFTLRVRFCEFVESRVDSAFWDSGILRNCRIAGRFESLRERGFYFLRKQKVAKTLRTACEIFVDSSLRSVTRWGVDSQIPALDSTNPQNLVKM